MELIPAELEDSVSVPTFPNIFFLFLYNTAHWPFYYSGRPSCFHSEPFSHLLSLLPSLVLCATCTLIDLWSLFKCHLTYGTLPDYVFKAYISILITVYNIIILYFLHRTNSTSEYYIFTKFCCFLFFNLLIAYIPYLNLS